MREVNLRDLLWPWARIAELYADNQRLRSDLVKARAALCRQHHLAMTIREHATTIIGDSNDDPEQ